MNSFFFTKDIFTKILYNGAIFFEKTSMVPIKIGIILLYRYPLRIFLYFCFKLKCNKVKRIVCRNSVTDIVHFNPFYSDLDLVIIISSDFKSEHERLNFNLFIMKLKNIFFFIDYPEIYTVKEFEKLIEIENDDVSKIFMQYILNIRKITWEHDKKDRQLSKYHRSKIDRSIRKSSNIIGGEVHKNDLIVADLKKSFFYQKYFLFMQKDLPDKIKDIPSKSQFMSIPLNIEHGEILFQIAKDDIFPFLALLPEGHDNFYEIYQEIRKRNKAIAKIYNLFCLKEYLVCRSVLRTWENPRFRTLDLKVHKHQIVYLSEELQIQ